MATRGREVLRGKLLVKLKKGNAKKRVLAAFCGLPANGEGGKAVSAQMQIFDDYEKIEKPGYKPKGSVKLDGAKIESSYITPPNSNNNSPAYASTLLNSQGHVNLSSSPLSVGSGSQSGSVPSSSNTEITYAFTVLTSNNELHEFRTDCENDRLRWVKLLQLLVMYPYSPIPEEPKVNPIKDSFRQTLEAKQYNANSVWPVYILPEEVGQKCGIIGQHILALRSGIPNVTMGQLEIISPTDHTRPVVTWDRDKMRRTGKTGHLVFLEIGRRCVGGPGLVWMYTGYQNDAQALRETLHRFLFQGDGSAVAMNSQPQIPVYDVPRSSAESQPSSQKRGSATGIYHNHLLRRNSQDQDSGYHSVNGTPPILGGVGGGPPVRLDKHPSFRQKRDSEASLRSYSNASSPPYGSYHDSDLFDCEQEVSGSAVFDGIPDGSEGPVMGHMDGVWESTQHQYDKVLPPVARQHSHPHYQAIAPDYEPDGEDQYMRMSSRTANIKDGTYVVMRSASFGESSSPSIPVPMPQAGGGMSAEYNTLQHFPNNQQRPSSRQLANSLNYETLPTISETKKVPIPERDSNYENHPLPQDLQGIAPRNYRPSYENRDTASFRGQRGLHGPDMYVNISQEVSSLNSNGNNNVASRRPSARRRNSEKEEVSFTNSHGNSSSPQSLSSSAEQQRCAIVGH